MQKAVMISIHPKWVEKIASGEKTVDVRKTVPKCGTPFKVYMYCTNDRKVNLNMANGQGFGKKGELYLNGNCYYPYTVGTLNGKVVGEFVCDKTIKAVPDYEPYFKKFFNYDFFDESGEKLEDCLTDDEKADYANGQTLYGLHISDLKIYDTPKELREFSRECKDGHCSMCNWDRDGDCGCGYSIPIENAPQSWCYVEVDE